MSSKLAAPKFSEFLKDFGKKDPNFAQTVHDRLAELVKLAKEVKQFHPIGFSLIYFYASIMPSIVLFSCFS